MQKQKNCALTELVSKAGKNTIQYNRIYIAGQTVINAMGEQGRGLGRVCVEAVLNRLVREGCPKTQCLSRDLKNVKE